MHINYLFTIIFMIFIIFFIIYFLISLFYAFYIESYRLTVLDAGFLYEKEETWSIQGLYK